MDEHQVARCSILRGINVDQERHLGINKRTTRDQKATMRTERTERKEGRRGEGRKEGRREGGKEGRRAGRQAGRKGRKEGNRSHRLGSF